MKAKTELDRFNPCGSALEFRMKFDTFEQAWSSCQRGDWMEWIALRLGVDDRKFMLAKGLIAKTVHHLMNDQRSIDSVNAAIAYGNGEISAEELKVVAADGYAAQRVAGAYYAASHYAVNEASTAYSAAAGYVAASAASDISDVPNVSDESYATAAYAANAVHAFARAATNASPSAVKEESLRKSADIFRELLTDEVIKKINEL